ncbi:MAG: class D sortase [Clostridiales bacterium]|nr:class D sortase [Clostridiales bacterium]
MKLINAFAAFAMTVAFCLSCSPLTFAADGAYATGYSFSSGPDYGSIFGKPTAYDEPAAPDPLAANERRDKNAAYFPPAYGVFSGEIPTDRTSFFHYNVSFSASNSGAGTSSVASTVSASGGSSAVVDPPEAPGFLPSTSETEAKRTAPWFYSDGSIGSIFITKLNKTIPVFEGESLDNLKLGIGHFASTSSWDGNVGLAGHNRGAGGTFGFVKDLAIGDTITYATLYGARTYAIYSHEKIGETDFSGLGWTDDNILTLITCVENAPELRWLVHAHEI